MSPIVKALKAFEDTKRDNFMVGGQYSLANTVPLPEVFNITQPLVLVGARVHYSLYIETRE